MQQRYGSIPIPAAIYPDVCDPFHRVIDVICMPRGSLSTSKVQFGGLVGTLTSLAEAPNVELSSLLFWAGSPHA